MCIYLPSLFAVVLGIRQQMEFAERRREVGHPVQRSQESWTTYFVLIDRAYGAAPRGHNLGGFQYLTLNKQRSCETATC